MLVARLCKGISSQIWQTFWGDAKGRICSLQIKSTWQVKDTPHNPCKLFKTLSWGPRPKKNIGETSSTYDQKTISSWGRENIESSNYGNEQEKLKCWLSSSVESQS